MTEIDDAEFFEELELGLAAEPASVAVDEEEVEDNNIFDNTQNKDVWPMCCWFYQGNDAV